MNLLLLGESRRDLVVSAPGRIALPTNALFFSFFFFLYEKTDARILPSSANPTAALSNFYMPDTMPTRRESEPLLGRPGDATQASNQPFYANLYLGMFIVHIFLQHTRKKMH